LRGAAPGTQRGVFGVLFAIMLPVMLGMVGLAIDLAVMYARGNELQSVADGTALAAARELDGTTSGLTAARERARYTAVRSGFNFLNSEALVWNPDVLRLGASAEGPWIAAAAAGAAEAPTLRFAMVNTAGLEPAYGRIAVSFLRALGIVGEQNMARSAVAGRKESNLTPLAVCALNNTRITGRSNAPGYDEALEYGFRRGVTYNLLNLNPNGTTPVNFALNPLDFPPAPQVPSHNIDAALRPFVCSGRVAAPPLESGQMLYVRAPFPASMIEELNSRFGDYDGSVCTKFGAAPDNNVVDFHNTPSWMEYTPVHDSADQSTVNGKLVSVADEPGVAAGTTFASYGPLWSFGKPLRYDSANGTMGAAFTKADWSKLYPVASGSAPKSNWGDSQLQPYPKSVSPNFVQPTPLKGQSHRRILNIALLECPVAGASARMLGIGRFLMTTPATSSPLGVHAEFGGLTPYSAMTASAVLVQ
jgi:hypothetical protein